MAANYIPLRVSSGQCCPAAGNGRAGIEPLFCALVSLSLPQRHDRAARRAPLNPLPTIRRQRNRRRHSDRHGISPVAHPDPSRRLRSRRTPLHQFRSTPHTLLRPPRRALWDRLLRGRVIFGDFASTRPATRRSDIMAAGSGHRRVRQRPAYPGIRGSSRASIPAAVGALGVRNRTI